MKKNFNNKNLSEAETVLDGWNIKYIKQPNGVIFVEGDLDIRRKGLTRLPDLTNVVVKGSFNCSVNELTSLKGSPQTVLGGVFCHGNKISNLEGAPQKVERGFWCSGNQLINLKGAPKEVTGYFDCCNNQLNSLEGAPQKVVGAFLCRGNKLTGLKGAPQAVEETFSCNDNPLTTLEGAPRKFKKLESHFGNFKNIKEIPENILYSPETRILMKKEAERKKSEAEKLFIEKCKKAIVLQKPLKIRKIRFN